MNSGAPPHRVVQSRSPSRSENRRFRCNLWSKLRNVHVSDGWSHSSAGLRTGNHLSIYFLLIDTFMSWSELVGGSVSLDVWSSFAQLRAFLAKFAQKLQPRSILERSLRYLCLYFDHFSPVWLLASVVVVRRPSVTAWTTPSAMER